MAVNGCGVIALIVRQKINTASYQKIAKDVNMNDEVITVLFILFVSDNSLIHG